MLLLSIEKAYSLPNNGLTVVSTIFVLYKCSPMKKNGTIPDLSFQLYQSLLEGVTSVCPGGRMSHTMYLHRKELSILINTFQEAFVLFGQI